MNITMTQVVFINQRLQRHPFDTFHVQARNIRLIHIPDKFDVGDEVRRLLDNWSGRGQGRKPRAAKVGAVRTFKGKRANANQQQTLRELAEAEQRQRQAEVAKEA